MARKARKSYTEEQRKKILDTAVSENLSAIDVQKRFGVTPVTYYMWRKKAGIKGPRGRKPGKGSNKGGARPAVARVVAASGDLSSQVRAGVQAKVREILPNIVREEVAAYLHSLFGTGRKRGRPRKL